MTPLRRKTSLPEIPRPEAFPWPPVEPPHGPAQIRFPDPRGLGDEWVVGVTRTMSPALVLQAYRAGIFPWPTSRSALIPWASPEPRTNFPLAALREGRLSWPRTVRRDLKRAAAEWQVTFDEAFSEVMRACADRPGEGTWITPELYRTYCALHALGWGHSVEVWLPATASAPRQLIGGLYGLAVGGLFAGESMFHRETGASKVAFASMAGHLAARGFSLFDVQAHSEHLASLGCVNLQRAGYLDALAKVVDTPVRFSSGPLVSS
jgi:leucyl/phenylalanyl-tRNA--protein transferase